MCCDTCTNLQHTWCLSGAHIGSRCRTLCRSVVECRLLSPISSCTTFVSCLSHASNIAANLSSHVVISDQKIALLSFLGGKMCQNPFPCGDSPLDSRYFPLQYFFPAVSNSLVAVYHYHTGDVVPMLFYGGRGVLNTLVVGLYLQSANNAAVVMGDNTTILSASYSYLSMFHILFESV